MHDVDHPRFYERIWQHEQCRNLLFLANFSEHVSVTTLRLKSLKTYSFVFTSCTGWTVGSSNGNVTGSSLSSLGTIE